ncbi:Ig-like domain-containing protein [Amphibiibacter pelophylacis]|uniref:Ig-like domain-containing protein n=1 Tax=Amphibiibacter pelophylacis TaxID=1799477 RepID=A0ACC6P290_9BURK
MNHRSPLLHPSALALAASALLAACGGGSAGAPPGSEDTTPPTLTLSDSVPGATATGPVTFTFTFSEPVSGFTAEDVTVAGGTAGAFSMGATNTTATLVVTPAANSTGTLQVNVAAGSFADLAGNASTAAASASQAFDTTVPAEPPPAGLLADFDTAPLPTFEGFEGAGASIEVGPDGGTGSALKIVRNGGQVYAGVVVNVPTIPSNAGTQVVSARVYSPTAGIPMVIKVEAADQSSPGDVQANETVKAGWQTLTWTLSNLDASKVYNRFVVLPQLGTVGSGETFFFDDIAVKAAPVTPPAQQNLLADFDTAPLPTFEGFEGAGASIAAGPDGGTGSALKIVRNGGQVYAGVVVNVPTIPSNAGTQTVSARVYSPKAGIPMVIKVEAADQSSPGDVQANETVKAGWQTLTWTLSNLDASKVYNRLVVLPQLGTVGSGETFFVDDITLAAKQSPEVPAASLQTFSAGFASNVLTSSGGAVATAGGSDLDSFNCNGTPDWCGSGSGGTGADSFVYFYYQTPSPASALYSQIEVFGPGITGLSTSGDTGGVTLGSQTKLNFTFNPNPEWYNSANNALGVVLTLGKRYAIDNGCHLQLHGVLKPSSVDATAYSMNLRNDFRVAADCGAGIAQEDVAAALAASPVVSSVKFVGAGGGAAILGRNGASSGANLTTAAGTVYPTTVALKGAITFD